PAAATPRALTGWSADSSRNRSLTALSISAASPATVRRLALATILPSSSTSPAAILVPPMSTPIAYMSVLAPDEGCSARAAAHAGYRGGAVRRQDDRTG